MLHITFRHLESSETIRSLADELFARLGKNHGTPARCHLVVEDNLKGHAHHDARFSAHIEVAIADISLQSHSANRDATVAIREAFEKAEHQLTRREDRRLTTQRGSAIPSA